MVNLRFSGTAFAIGLWVLGATSSTYAATPPLPSNAPVRVELTPDGYVMQTPDGRSLYYDDILRTRAFGFTTVGVCPDKPSIMSNDKESGLGPRPVIGAKFVKACTQKWPPFMADAGAKPVGDFTLTDRPEGKQWAWRGHPLYMSVKDKRPGDRNGNFIPGVYIGDLDSNPMQLAILPDVLPMELGFSTRDEGLVITTSDGKAVYTPKKGTRSDEGANEQLNPIYAPAAAILKDGWSAVSIGSDRKQLAFNGKRLYALSESATEMDIEETGGWETVVYSPAPKRPAEIGRHLTLDGEVYTTKEGRTLYTYTCNTASPTADMVTGVTCDDPGDAAADLVPLCGSPAECARRWKPYLAKADAKPSGLWSVVEVTYPMFTDPQGTLYPPDAPRVKVWAYRGNPLYTYYDDRKPGDQMGDRTYGFWSTSMFDMLHVPGHEGVE